MDALVRQLGNYAAYHRDARNVRTHMIGIPMIVLAIAILLSVRRSTRAGSRSPRPCW
jgi:uncharacterized membrane protein YGL010W